VLLTASRSLENLTSASFSITSAPAFISCARSYADSGVDAQFSVAPHSKFSAFPSSSRNRVSAAALKSTFCTQFYSSSVFGPPTIRAAHDRRCRLLVNFPIVSVWDELLLTQFSGTLQSNLWLFVPPSNSKSSNSCALLAATSSGCLAMPMQ
jgi:hypothetical protein